MNNLAELYRKQGKYEAAEPLYVDALAMWKKLLGEEHPDVAQSMNNLAALYYSQGKYEEAIKCNQMHKTIFFKTRLSQEKKRPC